MLYFRNFQVSSSSVNENANCSDSARNNDSQAHQQGNFRKLLRNIGIHLFIINIFLNFTESDDGGDVASSSKKTDEEDQQGIFSRTPCLIRKRIKCVK